MKKNILIGLAAIAVIALVGLNVIERLYSPSTGGSNDHETYRKDYEGYLKSAERGEAAGQYGLGSLYLAGIIVEKNHKKAFDYFLKAAEQGLQTAQRNVAVMYNAGMGVAKDEKEAFNWYHKAAEQKDSKAQFQIGEMYSLGRGVTRDEKAAYAWFTIAQESGEANTKGAIKKLAVNLTPKQISDANKFASDWINKHH